MMLSRVISSFVLAAVLSASLPAMAAKSPLEAIPASAGVVIRFKTPQTTLTRISKFASSIDRKLGPQVLQLGQAMGVMISNPKGVGVNAKKDWWIAVFPSEDPKKDASILFAVPAARAADVNKMRAVLGTQYKFISHEEWGLYTLDTGTLRAVRGTLAGTGKSVSTVIDAKSQAVMDSGDFSVFINVNQLREVYKVELEIIEGEIDTALEDFAEVAPEVPGMNLQPVFDMYGKAARALLQTVEDMDSFTFALSVGTRSITIEQYLKVKAGSATDKFLQANVPAEMKTLEKLPANQLAYFGSHGDMQSLTKWGMELSMAMFQGDEQQKKDLQETAAEVTKLKFGEMVSSFGFGKLGEGAIRTVSIMEVTPAAKMRELTRKSSSALSQFNFGPVSQSIDYQADAEKVGKHSIDILSVNMQVDEAADPLGFQSGIMAAIYGPDGMKQRLAVVDNLYVQTVGDQTLMAEVLQSLDTPIAEKDRRRKNPAFQLTRAKLSEKANIIALIDLPGIVSEGLAMVVESGEIPIPVTPDDVKKLKVRRSYLGFSLTTEPQGLRMKTEIPITQIQGFFKLGTLFQRLMQQLMPRQQQEFDQDL